MQAERAPYVGIVLALLILCAETFAFVAYTPKSAGPTPHAQTWHRVRQCQDTARHARAQLDRLAARLDDLDAQIAKAERALLVAQTKAEREAAEGK